MKLIPRKETDKWLSFFDPWEEEMQGRWDNYWGPGFPKTMLPVGMGEKFFSPAVDIVEDKENITVKADVPGMSKDQIEVLVEKGALIIKGEKKQEKETKEKGLVRSERYEGRFYRSFGLPAEVDEKSVRANYKDGVLEITLPKKIGAVINQTKVEVK